MRCDPSAPLLQLHQDSPSDKMLDFLALFLWRHNNEKCVEVLLRRFEDRGWWFPCFPINQADFNTEKFAKETLGITGHLRQIRNVKHYHCPTTNRKAVIVIHDFEIIATSSQLPQECKWMNLTEMKVLPLDEPLLGDDPQLFVGQIEGQLEQIKSNPNVLEIIPVLETVDDLMVSNNNNYDYWLNAKPATLCPSKDSFAKAHSDFVNRCWPGTEMTFATFKCLNFPVSLSGEESSRFHLQLWGAFNPQNSARLTFCDYLNALAMLDLSITTFPELFDIKLHMLFRFFARNYQSQTLTSSELNSLMAKLSSGDLNSKILITPDDGLITYDAFERVIREHYFEAFTKFSILGKITYLKQPSAHDSNTIISPSTKQNGPSNKVSNGSKHSLEDVKSVCTKSRYFRNKLNAAERDKFLELFGAITKEDLFQGNGLNSRASVISPITKQFQLQSQVITVRRTSQQLNLETAPVGGGSFSENERIALKSEHSQLAREMLSLLNDFLTEERCVSGKTAVSVSLFAFIFKWKTQASHQQFLQLLQRLVDVCEPILASEPRLLAIDSPCYVSGDFHGNYHDLSTLSHFLWHYGPSLCPAKLLFLGDYVDRGPNGLELLGYLMAQKLLAPDRIYLVRGNHDDPKVNADFFSSCSEACIGAYGINYSNGEEGRQIWLQINRLFAAMPLCAVIDGAIFCSHSGITSPRSGFGSLEDINMAIPPRLESLYDNDMALELGWNDPMLPEHAKTPEVQHDLDAYRDGFAVNLQRSTALFREKRILYFTTQALRRFMADNLLQFFVRAQESFRRGCVCGKETRTVIVSCSEAAFNATVLMVDSGHLQILRIHTQLMIRDLKGDTTTPLFEPPINNTSKQASTKIEATKVLHRINHSFNSQKAASNPYLPPIGDSDMATSLKVQEHQRAGFKVAEITRKSHGNVNILKLN